MISKKISKIRLKVCGMRDPENIAKLVKLEPDFIGFIFHELSPRYCDRLPETMIPESIRKVGVFVNKSQEYILYIKKEYHLDLIQLHGTESPDFCRKIQLSVSPVIKAFNLHNDFDFDTLKPYEETCTFFLFDASGPLAGGNGTSFNWQILQHYRGTTPFLLSGGIDEDMAEVIRKINHPAFYGVDINSRFEILPGIKDVNKIKQFKNELQS